MGLNLDYNLRRLERYLALPDATWRYRKLVGSGSVPRVALPTIADVAEQAGPSSVQQRVQNGRARAGQHVDVVAVNGRSASALGLLQPYLSVGQPLVLLGSSGGGKSTRTNSLLGSVT